MTELEIANGKISELTKLNEELQDQLTDAQDDLEGAKNDKTALYDLLMDLCHEIGRDVQDRTSEAIESAKRYVK